MANRLLRLTVHDPVVIKALDELRKSRKQSAFVVEALRHFLGTTQGEDQLESYLSLGEKNLPEPEIQKPERKEESSITQESAKFNLDDIFKI